MSPEGLDALHAQLSAASDDRERAGLFDAIGIALTRERRTEEALHYSDQALALRAQLADRDAAVEPLLGVSLFNRASHLHALGRFADAVPYHELAHRIFEKHLDATAEATRRFALNANGCAAALAALGFDDVAVRFQGIALQRFVEGAEVGDSSCSRRFPTCLPSVCVR